MMACCLTGRVYLLPHSVQVAIAPIPAIVTSSHRYDVCGISLLDWQRLAVVIGSNRC